MPDTGNSQTDSVLQRLAILEANLARLTAIEEIRQLKGRYFRLLDGRDFQAMADVFCHDAQFDCTDGLRTMNAQGQLEGPVGPVVEGRDNIMSWISESFADRTSLHHGHNHEVTIVSENEACGIVSMEDRIRTPDRRRVVIEAAGHYRERYRLEDGQWRIAYARLTRVFADVFD